MIRLIFFVIIFFSCFLNANNKTLEFIESLGSEDSKKYAFVLIDMHNIGKQASFGRPGFISGLESLIKTIVKKKIYFYNFNYRFQGIHPKTMKVLIPEDKSHFKTYIKYKKNIFSNKDFENDLQSKNIDTLIIAGAHTEDCITESVKGSLSKGYNVFLSSENVTQTGPKDSWDFFSHTEDDYCNPYLPEEVQKKNDLRKFNKLREQLAEYEQTKQLFIPE